MYPKNDIYPESDEWCTADRINNHDVILKLYCDEPKPYLTDINEIYWPDWCVAEVVKEKLVQC